RSKSRLASRLGAEERKALCRRLLSRTLEQALMLSKPGQIHLVTDEPEAAEIGRTLALDVVPDPDAGLNAAVALGCARASEAGERITVLPIDLPHVTADAIAAASQAGEIAIAPDLLGEGT